MRTRVDWRSASREVYNDFKKKYPQHEISFEQWKNIVYDFNEGFRDYILETGEKAKLPAGFGEFSITKKKREKMIEKDGKTIINLPIDWKKTREKGKKIYLMNYHTDGYFFGWLWFKRSAVIKLIDLWYFKSSRITSRTLSHYLKTDKKYQTIYKEWKQ